MKSISLILFILFVIGKIEAILGLVLLLYTLISEFWFVVLYIPFVVVLGVLFSKIKFPNVIYRLGGLSLIVGFLGLLGVVFYSIFVEKIEEKILYLFMGMTAVGMIITFPNFQGRKN